MLTLGAATVEPVVDLDDFRLKLDFIFPEATLEALDHARDWLRPEDIDFSTGEILLRVQSHIVRAGGLTILVDTCVGEHKPRGWDAWNMRSETGYLARLAAAGLRPEDIDVVMCTHLHADHVGWNTRLENGRWVPTFPKARYVMGRRELEHGLATAGSGASHGAFDDSVAPIVEAGLAEPVDDGFELAAGLSIVPLPGHTVGQIGLRIAHPGGAAYLCGDAIHSPAQLIRPDWSSRFDADQAKAAQTRNGLLTRAAGEGALILPAHLRSSLAYRPEVCGDHFHPHYL